MSLKSRLKRFLVPRLRARGHLLIPAWRLPDLPLEEHLRAVIARYDVDVVIDVGANLGQFHDTVRNEVAFTGPIVSFEPVGDFRSQLKARRHTDPAWHIEPFALGSTNGSAEIHVMESPGLSSLKKPDLAAMRSLLPAPERTNIGKMENIEVRRLDEIAKRHPALSGARRALLKTDTQGFDLEVIRGAGAFLAHTVAVQIELSVLPIYANAPCYQDVIAELHEIGFDLSGMFPVTLDRDLRVIEFDGVFVRRPVPAPASAPFTASSSARTMT
ncbi:MAG TPA: FkbM family methyltransferase [Gemmatimonadaceae bacterium]|nr:FkbM family methyltransferase [Gemmatimonadaceae bacterium]